MNFEELRPWQIGQRLRVGGYHYRNRAGHECVDSAAMHVLEVTSVEERGIVCELMAPRGDGTWRYNGHRMLYEWPEVWDSIEKL